MLHNRLTKEAVRANELAAINQQAEEYCRQMQDEHEAVMTAMHYLPKLFATLQTYIQKHDYEGLKSYFTKHVSPVFDQCICERHNLQNIEDEQIRNLVQITFGQIGMTMRDVTSELRVDDKINVPQNLSMIMFEIMSNLIDNALRHLKDQQTGYFRMELTGDNSFLMMSITNSQSDERSVWQIYAGRKGNMGRGFGLRRVRQIAVNTPEIELYTYQRGQFEGMPLLTQGIKIKFRDVENEQSL